MSSLFGADAVSEQRLLSSPVSRIGRDPCGCARVAVPPEGGRSVAIAWPFHPADTHTGLSFPCARAVAAMACLKAVTPFLNPGGAPAVTDQVA